MEWFILVSINVCLCILLYIAAEWIRFFYILTYITTTANIYITCFRIMWNESIFWCDVMYNSREKCQYIYTYTCTCTCRIQVKFIYFNVSTLSTYTIYMHAFNFNVSHEFNLLSLIPLFSYSQWFSYYNIVL